MPAASWELSCDCDVWRHGLFMELGLLTAWWLGSERAFQELASQESKVGTTRLLMT